MRILILSLLITFLTLPALAQNQVEYPVVKIKGEYMIIGQKPYKVIGVCDSFEEGDNVTFTADPITCEQVTALNVTRLTKCELECLENLELPPDPE